jgi:rhodanese-related sulfurtransferase
MTAMVKTINVAGLKAALHDGGEIALLDAREEVPFDARHILMASCLPIGRIEVSIDDLVPRRSARVIWCDDGDNLAEQAAARAASLGYSDVSVLEGGIKAWEAAGHRIYSGVHVPSKAFAEVVENVAKTPYITADELKRLIDKKADVAIFDTRSYEEYHSNSIPGAVSVPGVEIIYRFKDLTPSADTMVVVNCGGRTRSIIGAQALINAGVPNRVVSLKNGTQDWHLAGYEVVKGATRRPPEVSDIGMDVAIAGARRIAELCGIKIIDRGTLEIWRSEAKDRTLYTLDVRTQEEYEEGHVAGVKHIAGGQLVQETDAHLGTWGARVVLFDDNGIRATATASWLSQMGWEVAITTNAEAGGKIVTGPHLPVVQGLDSSKVMRISPGELRNKLERGEVTVIDLNWSRGYYEGHIPNARFAIRSRLDADLGKLPEAGELVFTSPDGLLAAFAAADRSAMALEGGTAAWVDAGLPLETGATNMVSVADDIRLKAREQGTDIEAAMRDYLAWEIELVNDMAEDDDHRFDVIVQAS